MKKNTSKKREKICIKMGIIFFISFIFSFSLNADEFIPDQSNNPEYYEAFIELRVGKQGDSFFPVLMNGDESPYIEINSFTNSWLGISPECSASKEICQIEIPGEEVHWINTSSKEFGTNKKSVKWGSNNSVIAYNQSLWIIYDDLDKFIPVNKTWSIRSYILSIIPKFKLAKERIMEIEIARKRDKLEKIEREKFNNEEAIKPISNYFYEGRMSYTSSYDFMDSDYSNYLNYDFFSDVMGGTFGIGGGIDETNIDEYIGYYFYENKEIDNIGYLALGDVRFEGSLIANGKNVENGFRTDRYYRENGLGAFSKREFTEPNSLIDIYINGFYQETVKADKYGYYVIDNISVKTGDVIRLREVSPRGLESEKKHIVVGANGNFLDKGDWDSQVFTGENEGHNYSYVDIKYGGYDHFTVGLQHYLFDSDNYQGSYNRESLTTALMLWRYDNNISLSVESDLSFNKNNAYRVDWIMNENSYFSWDSRKIDDESKLRGLEWFSDEGYDYNRFKYNFSYGRYQVNNTLLFSELDEKYNIEINRKLKQQYSLLFNNSFDFNNNDNFFSELILNKAMTDGGTVEGGLNYRAKITTVFGKWRYIGDTSAPWLNKYIDNPWSSTLSLSYNKVEKLVPTIDFDWQQTEWLSGNFSASKESVYLGMTAKIGFSNNKGRGDGIKLQSWENVGNASIEGYLLTPPVNGVREPLKDVEINVSNYSTRTDSNGYFFIKGIPANYEMNLFINEQTLDIRVLPTKKKWKVYFRPGTKIKMDPEMTWAVGVDGRVTGNEKYSLIRFIHQDSRLTLESALDKDGYYIIERLTPGQYDVEIIDVNNEKTVKAYQLGMGDWFSDVDFSL